MPNLLAIDTTTEACSVALLLGDDIREDYRLAPRQHMKLVLPMVDQLLSDAGMSLKQLDAIVFGQGPGSFTGLRVVCGVVQGICYGSDLPAIGVSTLAAMAQRAYRLRKAELVMSAIDARMDEVYWGVYQNDHGLMRPVIDEMVAAPSQVIAPQMPAGLNMLGVGTGWHFADDLTQGLGFKVADYEEDFFPQSQDMLRLAQDQWNKNELLKAHEVQPVYLRNTVTWKKLPGRE